MKSSQATEVQRLICISIQKYAFSAVGADAPQRNKHRPGFSRPMRCFLMLLLPVRDQLAVRHSFAEGVQLFLGQRIAADLQHPKTAEPLQHLD